MNKMFMKKGNVSGERGLPKGGGGSKYKWIDEGEGVGVKCRA